MNIEDFYKKYYKSFLVYTKKMLDNWFDAEEIVNIVFMNLLKNWKTDLPEEKLVSYAITAIKNTQINFYKRKKWEKEKRLQYVDNIINTGEDTFHDEIKVYLIQMILECFESLPPKRRAILNAHLKDYKVKEIAKAFNITQKTTRNLRNLGIADLKKMIYQKIGSLPNAEMFLKYIAHG